MIKRQQALVQIADLYVMYYRDDHAFTYLLQDPRAKEVDPTDVEPLWTYAGIDFHDAWGLKGMGIFSLISMHFWQQGIDFHYIDVGANYGLTAIAQAIFYKRCGRDNHTFAFEPGEVFLPLQETTRLNRIDDVMTCIRAAVSDSAGPVPFHVLPTQSPGSSLLSAAVERPGVEESHVVTIEALRMDDFIRTIRPTPGLIIKIDTEGADVKVLRGMPDILATGLAVIQIEFYPGLIDTYTNAETELSTLSERFEIIEIGAVNTRVAARDIGTFVTTLRDRPIAGTDLLLIPLSLPGASLLVQRILDN